MHKPILTPLLLKEYALFLFGLISECNFVIMNKPFSIRFHTLLLGILLSFNSFIAHSQTKKEAGFRSPLDIPLYLAGNFGELRGNHFHTGIDIKTQGVEGKAVYSIGDGYISRIKISTGGYGKAIYVRHPNGYTSVYAHLNKGNKEIEAYIQGKQYQRESFEIELFPEKGELTVNKGEIIAYSGNSGSSGGPHLHFEIRETKTEEPVNPLLFGFDIQDNIDPIIKGIRLYPLNDESYVSPYPGSAIGFLVEGSYGKYKLKAGQRIEAYGNVGLAIHTYDLLNGYPNKCGVYQIQLFVDSALYMNVEFEKLNFSHLRYINTYMDYPLYKEGRKYYHKQFIGPNNKLKIYETRLNDGVLTMNDGKLHHVQYIIKDSYGNTSTIEFDMLALAQVPFPIRRSTIEEGVFNFTVDGPNYVNDEEITLDIPPMALYNKMNFTYSIGPSIASTFGPVYEIGDEDVPLQKNFSLIFKNNPIPSHLYDKALVVMVDENRNLSSMGGKMIEGKMKVKSRYFGKYSLAVDTISPTIKTVNIAPNKDLSTYNTFSLKISDDLSGISTYRGTIDGQWILMEYDPKKELLTYRFDDDRVAKGKHEFLLTVKDEKGNESSYRANFIR